MGETEEDTITAIEGLIEDGEIQEGKNEDGVLTVWWVEPKKEEGIKLFSDQPAVTQNIIKNTVVNLAIQGKTQPEITKAILGGFGVFTDTPLMEWINKTIAKVNEPEKITKYEDIKDFALPKIEMINSTILEMEGKGFGYPKIADFIHDDFNVALNDNLFEHIAGVIEAAAEPPAPGEALYQTAMQSFIQMGMSAEAVVKLFEGTGVGQSKLKNTAKKLAQAQQLYIQEHPDIKIMTKDYNTLPSWLQGKIESIAQQMLGSGKTQEDTIWYIAYNFHLTEESVKPVVKKFAVKPVSQTQELLQAFKILGIGEELGGCTVANGGLGELAAPTVAYCQGVIKPVTVPAGETASEAEIQDSGKKIKHTTYTQNMYLTSKSDNVNKAELVYQSSVVGAGYKERLEAVERILQDWRFSCEKTADWALRCQYQLPQHGNLSINDQDTLRKAAIFLSSIDKVSKLPLNCIPKAIEYAKNHSIAVAKTSKPWSVNVFPETVAEWESMVCSKVK